MAKPRYLKVITFMEIVFFIGMFSSHDWCRVGSWILCRFLWIYFILTSVRRSGEDKLCWRPTKGWGFEVGGYYCSLLTINAMPFPWKNIWKSKVPPRVAFFSWTIALGKFLLQIIYGREALLF